MAGGGEISKESVSGARSAAQSFYLKEKKESGAEIVSDFFRNKTSGRREVWKSAFSVWQLGSQRRKPMLRGIRSPLKGGSSKLTVEGRC